MRYIRHNVIVELIISRKNNNMKNNSLGVNMFENRKVAKRFIDILEAIVEDEGKEAGEAYRNSVVNLFWDKQVSEEGEFESFKISERDLQECVANFVK